MRTDNRGFTLIELMVVVAVISILAAIGYPSYTQYIVRAHRSSAQVFMFTLANKQEQYIGSGSGFYAGDAAGNPAANQLHLGVPADVSGKYTVTVSCTMPVAAGNCTQQNGLPTYLITAVPKATDAKCGTLTLDHLGTKTPATKGCW